MKQENIYPLARSGEVAGILGVSPGTLRRWRCEGKSPQYIKIGGTVFYQRVVVNRWLEKRIFDNTSQHDAMVGDNHG